MMIGRLKVVACRLPELTDREQRALSGARIGYAVGADQDA